jgi:hypothetical protein
MSGKFVGSIDERDGQFVWSVTLAEPVLSSEQTPIAEGSNSTMEEALIVTYRALAKAIAAHGVTSFPSSNNGPVTGTGICL